MKSDKLKRLRDRSYELFREAESYLKAQRAKGVPYEEYWPHYRTLYSEAMRLSGIVQSHTR